MSLKALVDITPVMESKKGVEYQLLVISLYDEKTGEYIELRPMKASIPILQAIEFMKTRKDG